MRMDQKDKSGKVVEPEVNWSSGGGTIADAEAFIKMLQAAIKQAKAWNKDAGKKPEEVFKNYI